MYKHMTYFHSENGEYVWDYFNLFIQERIQNEAPKLYHIWWPYDTVSHQAPQRATCYQWWELLINQDITHEVDVRTAAMNFVVLSSVWIWSLHDKKILVIWTWKVAKEFIKQVKEYDPWVSQIDYHNHHGIDASFEQTGVSVWLSCNFIPLESLSDYDIIVLHTSSKTPVITKDLFLTAKPNVIITSFAWTSGEGEVASDIYNNNMNIIVDWEQTTAHASDLKTAIEKNQITTQDTITIKDLVTRSKKPQMTSPIIYRSTGAPMQTLAIVKLLK